MSVLNWPRAILFDLDGTLVDSAPDIAAAANQLLTENGMMELDVSAVRMMIGNGVRKLVERAFAHQKFTLSDADIDQQFARMKEIYGDHLTNFTVPYQGVQELLQKLRDSGVKCAVVTNKPEGFSRQIVSHFGWDRYFEAVVGGDTLATRKPEPEMLFHACEKLGVAFTDAVMVGDSAADVDAAKNANIESVIVRGGYTRIPVDELGANIIIDNISELPNACEFLNSGR